MATVGDGAVDPAAAAKLSRSTTPAARPPTPAGTLAAAPLTTEAKRAMRPLVRRSGAVPKHLALYALLGYVFYSVHQRGWLPLVAAGYCLLPFVSPFGDTTVMLRLVWRLLRGPFPGYHWSFNLTSLALLLTKTLLVYPIETALWHADNVLFPGYRAQPVTKPLFLLGQPRSGTTRFEEILSEDKESLMALTLFEMRYPYLTVQYAFDGLAWLDRTLLRGALRHVAFDVLHLNKPFGGKGARAQMRRLQYELSDEDDIVFLFHQLHHFQLIGAAPDDEFIRLFYHFDHLPEASQRRALSFHRQCVQKALYRRGHGRTYFAKWVAGWNGQLDAARSLYPDAQYIVIVRDPAESVPSWLKLQGLLAADLTGENMMDRPHLHHAFKEENIAWFHNEIRFCRSIASQNITILDSDQFYRDIQGDVRKVRGHGRCTHPPSQRHTHAPTHRFRHSKRCHGRVHAHALMLTGARSVCVFVCRCTSTWAVRSSRGPSLIFSSHARRPSRRRTARPRRTSRI
jgi:hypothetical protein